MRNIGQEKIKQIVIPITSLEEQQQIVQEIESRLSVCDKIEETITNSLKQADALRQSILKKAFEGQLLTA
jgi:type I restriction enzyme S subunit